MTSVNHVILHSIFTVHLITPAPLVLKGSMEMTLPETVFHVTKTAQSASALKTVSVCNAIAFSRFLIQELISALTVQKAIMVMENIFSVSNVMKAV